MKFTSVRSRAQAMAVGRVLVGVGLLAAPSKAGRGWVGDSVDATVPRMLVQSIGVRDLLLGIGTLSALRAGKPARTWLQIAVAADAADALLTLRYFGSLPATGRIGTLAITIGAAYAGLRTAARVDDALLPSPTSELAVA